MPLICAATSWLLRYGSSPVVVRFRPQFGSRSRSVCGPNMPVTMKARLSVPSVWPQAFARSRSNVAPSPISVIGAVEPRAFGPDVFRTPCASVQQMFWMLGVVPVEASTGPTLWQLTLFGLKGVGRAGQPLAVFAGVSCSIRSALESSPAAGGLVGSSCAIRFRTAGVYGAAASSVGAAAGAGSETGIEYGGASADADDNVNIETTAATAMTKETFARRFLGEQWVALIAATPLTRETGLRGDGTFQRP